MKDKGKTKEELLNELSNLRRKVSKLEKSKTHYKKIEEELKKHQQHLEELVKQRTMELEKINMQLKNELGARKKTEETLRESENLYKTLVKTSPDAVNVIDLNGYNIEVSQRVPELFGYKTEKEMLGKHIFEGVAPKDHKKAKMLVEKVLQKGFFRNVELTFLRKDKSHFIGETNAALIRDISGKPKAIIGTIRDITERKKAERELKKHREHLEELVEQRTAELARTNEQLKHELAERKRTEEALRESEELYRNLLKTSPDIVAVSDVNGIFTEVSQRTVELFGYQNAEELIGQDGLKLIAPEDYERLIKNVQKVLANGFLSGAEYIAVKKDGSRFIIETNAALVRDAKGKPKAFISTSRDITERKRMIEELKKYREHLEQLVEERTRDLLKTQKEVKTLRKQILQNKKFPEIIGKSTKILQILDLVQQVARTNSTVLIYGETGSGKDLIAKAIHFNSERKDGAFLTINCAALPEHLIESELFGYVKGAFTGANQDKKGLFEESEKGTIFLNEISEMPIKVQAKILHVIENQQVRRLGQSRSITVDVRIVAASNIDLEQAVKKGTFREDLFYRLSVFPITVPPLRDRKEDIPLLVKHFLDKYKQLLDKKVTEISPQAMDILCNYSFPGNVRELENIIQRSLILAQGNKLLANYLPEKIKTTEYNSELNNLADNLADREKQIIEDIIKECKGNLSQSAKKLGICRTTLWRKIKKLKIDTSDYVA
jgi:two-component system response regulator AtoC